MKRSPASAPHRADRAAARFVLLMGVVSLLADATYEGARSVLGPYLLALGASATAVGFVAGLGELAGYGLRLVSGRLADRTRRYWAFTFWGYVVNLISVPALALAGRWEPAGALVILERAGKAVRTPPRDAMLSHAATRLGTGWAFGLHEALDQVGAVAGPLGVAGLLAAGASFRQAFAALAAPAVLCLVVLARARAQLPHPSALERPPAQLGRASPRVPKRYLFGVALLAAGFPDFALLAYHLSRSELLPAASTPALYAVAMATDAGAALLLGRWFDRHGTPVLALGTLVAAAASPLVVFGGGVGAAFGMALWGAGMGLQESVLRAAVARMAPPDRRASAFGLFHTVYGAGWFAGSAAMGVLYDLRPDYLAAFAVTLQVAAALLFARTRPQGGGVPAGDAGPLGVGGESSPGGTMKLSEEGLLLRVYVGESDRWHDRPLYEAIVLRAREMGLAGATVLRGLAGFGASSRIHTAKLLRLSEDLPVVVEIADEVDRIERFLPVLDEMITEGLVTLEKVRVILYRHRPQPDRR
ncbi:MAG: DUF190 domain-containing protein [Armatimonadota bacterium]|nr:DUF190 domain-containing protein [Armatimonadota bacterium]